MTDKLVLKATEVADLLGICRSRVYEMMRSGELPSITMGGRKGVPVRALNQWIDDRCTGGKPSVNV
ncbi:MAG: helix-turn-helix domain-containing protein [Chloroflexi bacterium]|nr:helix-turn-helix domain-containing protein [Chloroflexota bacterium]